MSHLEDYASTAVDGKWGNKISSEEYYANRTANASIIAEGQRALFQEYQTLVCTIHRAVKLIQDEDARQAIHLRYEEGYSYKATALFMKGVVKSATLDRQLAMGLRSVANTLKGWRFFDTTWNI
ncbi:hypothetical protein [Paenibacillus koleovorans]|uniref:hypothetical protein n=1 Tax=Paenibacillus koleovorans TaxID=121608 RepID=UPI000FDBB766|nr:hypothetical protein [Paenibacillus koleovorans]